MSASSSNIIKQSWLVFFGFYGLICIFYLLINQEIIIKGVYRDSDDAMRLVQIRDWLQGQGWFDLKQYRLFPEDPMISHWSRLIDAPLGIIIAFFSLFLSPFLAMQISAILWPLFLLFPALLLCRLIHLRFYDAPFWPVLIMVASSSAFTNQFAPMRVDHHNVQLLLMLSMLLTLLHGKGRLMGFLCGLSVALSLAIGLEIFALIIVTGLIVALYIISVHYERLYFAQGFAAGLALTSCLVFLTTIDPALWSLAQCDALSLVFVVSSLGVALLFGLTASLSLYTQSRLKAFLNLTFSGLSLIILLWWLFPHCQAGPFSQSSDFTKYEFMANISEAASFSKLLSDFPIRLFIIVLPFMGMTFCLISFFKERRHEWLILFSFIAVLAGIGFLQLRSFILATVPASLAVGCFIAHMRQKAQNTTHQTLYTVMLLFCLAPFHLVVFALLFSDPAKTILSLNHRMRCIEPEHMKALNAAPQGLMASDLTLGAHLLLYTHHDVVVAPYHRLEKGLQTGIGLMRLTPEDALGVIDRYAINSVILCEGSADGVRHMQNASDGLYAALIEGREIDGLKPFAMPEESPFKVFIRE